jgi:cytoskeletal protein RodZ
MIWRKERPTVEVNPKAKGFDDFELRLGDILRGERATLGKSLLDVQRELHIRAAHIAAIENGDLTAFEAPSFVAGFVRSYARYLGMDPEWVYERFCIEHGFAVSQTMTAGPAAQRPQRTAEAAAPGAIKPVGFLPDPEPFWRRVEPGALGSITVLAALIGGLGFAGWTILQEVQRVQVAPADLIPNVVTDLNPLVPEGAAVSPVAIDTDPLTAAPGSGAVGQVRIARPQALDVPVLVPRDGPIAAIQPDFGASPQAIRTDSAIAEALAGLDDGPALPQGATPAVPVFGAAAAVAPQVIQNGPPTVQILAVRPSWMRVRAANGTVIFERILDAGETWTLPATEAPPTLHAGNSGSVYFVIDGQPYGPAAPGANVVRNVTLSVEDLRAAYQVADLSRDADLAVHVARLRGPAASD